MYGMKLRNKIFMMFMSSEDTVNKLESLFFQQNDADSSFQTGKFVLRNQDLGCAISDKMCVWTRKFWKCSEKRALRNQPHF